MSKCYYIATYVFSVDRNRQFLGMDGSFEENFKRLEDIEEEAESMGRMDLRPERDDPVINKYDLFSF